MNFLKETWVYILAYVIIFPIFILVALLNSILRLVLSVIFLWTKHELAPSADSMFHAFPGHSTILVVLMCESDDKLDLVEEINNFKINVLHKTGKDGSLTYAKLKKKWEIRLGYGCWKEDENFKEENHFRLIRSGSRDKPLSETDFLKDIVPSLTEGMDPTRPQWEWLIVPNILVEGRSSPQTVRIFRFHHSYMDGVSVGLMLMDSMLKFDNSNSKHPFVVDPFLQLKFKDRLVLTLEKLSAPLRFPLMFARGIVEAVPKIPEEPFLAKKYSGKVHLANSKLLDAALLRKIKQIHGPKATVTSVVSTVLKDSLRKLLKTSNSKRPREGTYCALETVVGVLPVPDWTPRNDFMYHGMPFDINQDGLVPQQTPSTIFVTRFFVNWATTLPISFTKALLVTERSSGSAYFSNVPFSKEEGKLWGAPVNEVSSFIALFNPIGFAMTVGRYGKYFRFSIIAEDACMDREELQNLLDNMSESIKDFANQN